MAGSNGSSTPILISGGGIGGLVCAYALAQKGFPVRLFEQSSEFREVGAGIQLGPNIFRVLEKIGLKDAILADAHVPPGQEMRDALTGKLVLRIPLDDAFSKRFGGQPYAVTHRADIHGTFLESVPELEPGHAGDQPPRRRLHAGRQGRHRHAGERREGPGPRPDRLRRHVVEDPR